MLIVSLSCNNDLNLIDEWKEIPVVYGFVSRSDTATYIRVEKAFLDQNVSPQVIAQSHPDSIYYDPEQITVKIIKSNNTSFTLNRVDGTLEGYPRTSGLFVNNPNYLYKIKNDVLNPVIGETVKLMIIRNSDQSVITEATTKIVGDFRSVLGLPNTAIPFGKNQTRFSFESIPAELNAAIFDLNLYINYTEYDVASGETVAKTLEWPVQKSVTRGTINDRIDFYLDGPSFYTFLKNNISGENKLRYFQSIDYSLISGGNEIRKYIEVGNVAIGITGAEATPTYSNLSNGYGIFSSKNVYKQYGYSLTQVTLDSLKHGSVTSSLRFQ